MSHCVDYQRDHHPILMVPIINSIWKRLNEKTTEIFVNSPVNFTVVLDMGKARIEHR